MSNDNNYNNKEIAPIRREGLLKKDSGLVSRGLELAQSLNATSPQADNTAFLLIELDKAYSKEDWNIVIELSEQVLQLDVRDQLILEKLVTIYINRGFAYQKLENYKEALLDFNHAIKLIPSYPIAYHRRAVTYMSLANC